MQEVAIVGAAMVPFGRYPDQEAYQLGARAALDAMKDAGVGLNDIQIMSCGQLMATSGAGQRVLQQIGQTGIPVVNTANACATGSTALREGFMSIAAGMHDIALVVGQERMGTGLTYAGTEAEGYVGSGTMPAVFAMAGMEHTSKYGTTIEQFAKVAVKAKKHAAGNPYAKYRDPITVDDVLKSRLICDPLHLLDCCIISDGGGAIVVAHPDIARNAKTKPVWLLGSGEAAMHSSSGHRDFTVSAAAQSGPIAFKESGVSHQDVDFAMIYDAFSINVIMTLEDLGFCKKGEGGAFVEDGRIGLGGQLPVNPDGGGLSSCHPGMRGMFLLVEATRQLWGDFAGTDRQVPNAKVAAVHGIGGFYGTRHSGITAILTNE